jgi:hypothetical protein
MKLYSCLLANGDYKRIMFIHRWCWCGVKYKSSIIRRLSIGLGGKFFTYKFSKWLCALWSGAPCRRSRDVLFSTMQKNISLKHSYTIIKMDMAKNDDNQRHFSWFYKVGNLWKINGIKCICAKIMTI